MGRQQSFVGRYKLVLYEDVSLAKWMVESLQNKCLLQQRSQF